MDDLISRQAAIDTLESGKDKTAKGDIGGFYNAIIQNDIDKLRDLPSAQPEVIRCKDCWHYPGEFSDCPMIGWARNENDYCSKAEGRNSE